MKRVKHLVSGLTLLALAQCLGWLPPALALTPGEAEGYRGRYLEVLRSLATEGLGVATAALVHFETSVAIRHGASGLDALRELELEVATELAQSDANLLLPLIGLHERSHIEYRRRILEANPYHARATVYRQIELYSQQLHSPSERRIAADLFVSLAGHFHEGSSGPGVAGLYTRALQYDPDCAAALLGLATLREQAGRYRNALSLLERLAETGHENAESRLRLAMNMGRLGKSGEAEGLLENLISEPGPDWVSSLAFQELARIRLDQGRLETARDLLARGLARHPDDPGLAVGLTWVDDRLGSGSELPFVPPMQARGAEVSSARYLYARPEYPYIEETREQLRNLASQYLPLLNRTLTREVE